MVKFYKLDHRWKGNVMLFHTKATYSKKTILNISEFDNKRVWVRIGASPLRDITSMAQNGLKWKYEIAKFLFSRFGAFWTDLRFISFYYYTILVKRWSKSYVFFHFRNQTRKSNLVWKCKRISCCEINYLTWVVSDPNQKWMSHSRRFSTFLV